MTGRYHARLAATQADMRAARALRHRAFGGEEGLGADAFDAHCSHVLIEEAATGDLAGCFRLMLLMQGQEVAHSYSAQFYDLTALQGYSDRLVEMGRFCLRPGLGDPDVLRVAWGAMTQYVDDNGIEMLFGCSSFAGTDAARYRDAFALLGMAHLAPAGWRPGVRAPSVFRFASELRDHRPDRKRALRAMPPLLRSYLLMGGRVSDHAVVDRKMNTLHVFTGVEIRHIPAARKRVLRALAQPVDAAQAAR